MGRILLAEQTNIMKIRMEKMLQNIGYNKLLTYDGVVLNFDKYYRLNEKVNLVIINRDQFKSELELMLNCINSCTVEDDFKLIIVTSEINHNEVLNLYSKGVDEIILKPFTDEEIARKITKSTHRENRERNFEIKKKIMGKVRILKWCSEFEIGVEKIDNENKIVIEHYEKLYELMKTGQGYEYYKELIEFLRNYVGRHFEFEENFMEEIQYDEYQVHKNLHRNFKEDVENLIKHYNRNNPTDIEMIKLNLFIKNWISDHILIEDKKIGKYTLKI